MKIHWKLMVLWMALSLLLWGCRMKKPLDRDYYGNELYNASYVCLDDDNEVIHNIPIMSVKDVTKVEEIELTYTGGTFDYRFVVSDGQYEYDGYRLYTVNLYFSNIAFEKQQINIEQMRLKYNDAWDSLALDKCQLVPLNGELNQEIVNINGSPLRMPSEMTRLPLELSANKDVTIDQIFLTNEEMKFVFDGTGRNSSIYNLKDYTLKAGAPTQSWFSEFIVGKGGDDFFKHYGTSIVICYTYNGKSYCCIPAIPRTIYNPFNEGFGSIEKYFAFLHTL